MRHLVKHNKLKMSNQTENLVSPPRNITVPNVPNPQTNEGTLEHSGIPITPALNITDIPPNFMWMCEQWKYHDNFQVKAVGSAGNAIGDIVYTTRVVMADEKMDYVIAQWYDIPFACSKWWNGKISYRFTIIKPPRVPGKLLVKFRQDAFNKRDVAHNNNIDNAHIPPDYKYRSIVKEWDLAQSNQFELDLVGSTPIQARPTHLPSKTPKVNLDGHNYAIADYIVPWTTYEMGRITIEIAQGIIPGSIFPDTYDVIVEKSLKDAIFYTPTDPRTTDYLSLYDNPELKP